MARRKTSPEPGDPAAGNGILSRRIFLEGALAAGAAGAAVSGASAEPLTVQPWMKVPGAGFRGLRPALAIREQGREGHSAAAQPGDARCRRGAHAAAPARRNHHAIRAALRTQPFRHSRHRSRSAPAGDPWAGEAPARVHGRSAAALSDAIAHRVHRVCRQQPGAQRAASRSRSMHGGHSRLVGMPGMDRREALDAARRSRRRAVGALGDRRGRRCRRHEPQHPARQGDG